MCIKFDCPIYCTQIVFLGILHSARPSDTMPKGNGRGLPAEVIGMARQMGLTPEDMKQMASMWANMDDLAASVSCSLGYHNIIFEHCQYQDPDTYKKFTEDILKDGPPNPGHITRSFMPNPSFVVKATFWGCTLKFNLKPAFSLPGQENE